jgi:chromosome segregation ATPase
MTLNRRLFIISLTTICIIKFENYKDLAYAQENKDWLKEFTSTIKGTIAFVDDVRASLKRQGVEIDRQKLKPSVTELNISINALLSNLKSLRRTVDRKDNKDSEIAASASNLSPKANRMIRSMEAMFKQISSFDTALEKHRSTIYQLVDERAETVERIRLVTVRPVGGKIDRKELRSELNNAIKIGSFLLQSIQGLIMELG